jgi:hypothetical protein
VKILYVEDELSKNIPGIIRLFGKYLGKKKIRRLKELEEDESGYGADPDEIKGIVEETEIVEVEYRFPDALRKIVSHYERYALLIIDRNLAEYDEYEFEEVVKIDPAFTDSKYETYFEREGDYFLQKLVYQTDVMSKFYLLTGNSDPIRCCDDIKTLIDFGQFSEKNSFEKGNEAELQKIIENMPVLNLQNENKRYLEILRKNIGNKGEDNFLKILEEKDEIRRISANLTEIRKIYDQILKECSERIPDMKEDWTDKYGNVIMKKKKEEKEEMLMNWLSINGHINTIIRNFFFSIKAICSDFGAHPNIEDATTDTVNSLVYALKDVIAWFGKICSRYPKAAGK